VAYLRNVAKLNLLVSLQIPLLCDRGYIFLEVIIIWQSSVPTVNIVQAHYSWRSMHI